MAILAARDIEKTVELPSGPLTILRGVELAVESAESVALVGASGSGKSTLLGILAGLDLPSGGQVQLLGHELGALDEDERAAIRAFDVGFVFQSFQLLPSLTALENVMLPLELRGETNPKTQARDSLAAVGLDERQHHYPLQLSGGEQQRVAIARAFVGQPKILFADEPTGNLDAETGSQVAQLLFELNSNRDTTLVLVTHDSQLAARCDRTLEMHHGELVNAVPLDGSSSPAQTAHP